MYPGETPPEVGWIAAAKASDRGVEVKSPHITHLTPYQTCSPPTRRFMRLGVS